MEQTGTPAKPQEQIATDQPEQEAAAQPQPKKESQQPVATPHTRAKWWGCLTWPLQILNSPWLLATVPLLMAGIWLMNNTWIITNNLDKPYLLAAGPAAVASVVAGWLIIKFFATIASWCRVAWRAIQRGRKEDANGQFFWMTIAVFMAVSVMESGQFFDTIIHHVVPALGYATALVIDLIAVNLMQARLEAVRMHDKKGASLYLIGVAVCASLSAFANLYTALSGFNHVVSGELPTWMNSLAPWLAMAFPAMILLMSLTADYSLDRTSTKLDANKYREQENKRLEVLQVRRDMDKERLSVEQELATIAQQRKASQSSRNDREFFLVRWFFPRKPTNTQQVITDVTAHIREEFGKHLQSLYAQIHQEIGQAYQSAITQNGSQIHGIQRSIEQIDLEMNLLVQGWNSYKNTVTIEPLIDQLKASELVVKVDANGGLHTHETAAQFDANKEGQKAQKSLTFTPTSAHKKALECIQAHPEWRAKFAEIMSSNPSGGLNVIAVFLRRNGLNYSSLTPSFVGEVIAMLTLSSETGEPREQGGRHQKTAPKTTSKNTGREGVNTVNGPTTPVNRGEQSVNFHAAGERDEVLHGIITASQFGQVEDVTDKEREHTSSERETDQKQAAVMPSIPTMPARDQEREPEVTPAQIAANSAPSGAQNTEAIEAIRLPKITRHLTPDMLPGAEENTEGFSDTIPSGLETPFSPNREQHLVNTSLDHEDIPSDFAAQEILSTQPIFANLPTSEETGEHEFDTNFDEDEEAKEGEFDANKERSTRRGPYHLTAEEVAEKYGCTVDQVKYAVEQNQLRLSNRTDQSIDPVEGWKILTSSLEGWTPPMLPKKRGRPSKKQQEHELAGVK